MTINIDPSIRSVLDPNNQYTDEEILSVEHDRDSKNIPTGSYPIDNNITRYIEDVPIGWIIGTDEIGNLSEVIATDYDESTDTYTPSIKFIISSDEDVELVKEYIKQYTSGVSLLSSNEAIINAMSSAKDAVTSPKSMISTLADPGISTMSSMNTLYTSKLRSQNYVTFKAQYRFTDSDAANRTISSQVRMIISANRKRAVSVNVTCGHTGLAGATSFNNYANRLVSVSNGVSGYSWPNTYYFGYWSQTVTMNTTTTSGGKTYLTRKVNYRGRCTSTGNSSLVQIFTSSNIAVQFPNLDHDAPTTTLSLNSKTYNSITLNISTDYHSSQASYIINGASAVTYTTPSSAQVSGGGSYTKTFSGLSPNTTYTIQIRHYRGFTELWGSYKSISATTSLPGSPTCSSLTLVSSTYNSVTVEMSGAYGTGHPSNLYGYYRVKLSTQSSWTRVSNQNAHTISGLSPNTTYTVQAQLVDYYGQASSTRELSVTTPKPAAPTAGTISVSSSTYNSISVSASGFSFSAGASWGYYQWYRNGTSITTTGSTSTYTFTGLSPNTSYTLGVRLVDNYSQSSSTATVVHTTPKPAAPTAGTVIATSISYNSITYTWSGFSVGSGATAVKYEYNFNNQGWVSNNLSTTVSMTDIDPDTDYTMQVRIVDNFDQYGTSDMITTHTDQAPAAGTGTITADSVGSDFIEYSWSGFTTVEGMTIESYEYQWNGSSSWTNVGLTTILRKDGLSPDTLYTIRVRAVNNYGIASGVANFSTRTKKPNPPTISKFEVVSNTGTTAELSFEYTSYDSNNTVEYSINGGEYIQVSTNTIHITDLITNTYYTVVLRVTDSFGQETTKSLLFITKSDQLSFITKDTILRVGSVYVYDSSMNKVRPAKSGKMLVSGVLRNILSNVRSYAVLLPGTELNSKLKELPQCSSIVVDNSPPTSEVTQVVLVSDPSSPCPIYAYVRSDTIHIAPIARGTSVRFNEDSEHSFEGLSYVTSIDLTNSDMSYIAYMEYFMSNCKSLTTVILPECTMNSLMTMREWVSYCQSLSSINFDNLYINNVAYSDSAFCGCSSLSSLDLSNFNTTNLRGTYYMFGDCTKLSSEITISGNNITEYGDMFYNCSTDPNSLFIVNYSSDEYKQLAQELVNTKSEDKGSNVYLIDDIISGKKAFAVYSQPSNSLKFYKRYQVPDMSQSNPIFNEEPVTVLYTGIESDEIVAIQPSSTTIATNSSTTDSPSDRATYIPTDTPFKYAKNIASVVVVDEGIQPISIAGWFNGNLYSFSDSPVIDITKLDTSSVTSMEGSFCHLNNFEVIGAENLKFDNVTTTKGMFRFSNPKTQINITINSTTITDYEWMFYSSATDINSDIIVVNYTNDDTKALAESMVDAKSTRSKVYLYGTQQAFAVYSAADSSLRFYKRYDMPDPNVGLPPYYYDGNIIDALYTGIETNNIVYHSLSRSRTDENVQNIERAAPITNSPFSESNNRGLRLIEVMDEGIQPINMDYWFDSFGVSQLELSLLDTSKVTSMIGTFQNIITEVSVNGLDMWDLSNLTNTTNMFNYFTGLNSSMTINSNKVTSYSSMFYKSCIDDNARFILKYTDDTTKTLAEKMVATKSSDSNVFLYGTES